MTLNCAQDRAIAVFKYSVTAFDGGVHRVQFNCMTLHEAMEKATQFAVQNRGMIYDIVEYHGTAFCPKESLNILAMRPEK